MLHKVSEIRNRSKGTVKIGDTLFVDGTPYTECGRCNKPIKVHDGNREIIAGRDKRNVVVKPYKITILLKWLKTEEYDWKENVMTVKCKPILKQVNACYDCWEHFQTVKALAKANGHLPAIKVGE